MKFLTATLLFATVSAYVPKDRDMLVKDETCDAEGKECETETNVCVKRTVDKLAARAPANVRSMQGHQKVDPDLKAVGNKTFACFKPADSETLVAASGTADRISLITASYEVVARKPKVEETEKAEDAKTGSIHITLGAATAAAMMALTF